LCGLINYNLITVDIKLIQRLQQRFSSLKGVVNCYFCTIICIYSVGYVAYNGCAHLFAMCVQVFISSVMPEDTNCGRDVGDSYDTRLLFLTVVFFCLPAVVIVL